MNKVGIIIAEGFEEIEFVSVVDVLRRLDVVVDVLSLSSEKVTGAHNITIECDDVFDYNSALNFDGIVFPGGMANAVALSENNDIICLVNRYIEEGKMVAGICATPALLFPKTKLDRSSVLTCFPDDLLIKNLREFNYVDKDVVVCKNIITSKSPFTAIDFAFAIGEYLGYNTDTLK